MGGLRVVPWINFEELDTVHKWLYSQSPEEAQHGVDRVKSTTDHDWVMQELNT